MPRQSLGLRSMSRDAPHADFPPETTGVILVDHGSKVAASNQLLETIAANYLHHSNWTIVEPAHMELAEPSIDTAFGKCIELGAKYVVVMPYFLGPGRHSSQDIPRLSAAASETHGNIPFQVTAPLGIHQLLLEVVDQRISEALLQQHS